MVFLNEVVEVVYAGQKIRGVIVEVFSDGVLVEAKFGRRKFAFYEVTGLQFMAS